jgi:hypothetical protein
MVLSQHYYTGITDAYSHDACDLKELSNKQLAERISLLKKQPRLNAKGHFLIADDCETLSGMIKSIEGGIHLGAQALAEGDSRKLGEMMWECTRNLQNLSSVPKEDFYACAQLLARFGRLKANAYKGELPSAQIALSIVSAKGASFKLGESELNGHACTVAQTLAADGKASYCIGEGTTNLNMRNLPDSCPKKVSLLLSNGHKIFDTSEALTIIGQNMAELVGTGQGQSRIGQTIPCSFGGKDPYSACPFYMASFFMALEMGKTIPAIIPIDARNTTSVQNYSGHHSLADAIPQVPKPPLFGAPVAGLSYENVRAIPINVGAAMGQDKAQEFLSGVHRRNLESYPPRASEEKLCMLMSRWGDLQPLNKDSIPDENWILSSAESFQCADMLRAVAEHKTRLAREFNALQAKDPASDGVQMQVKQHMLSVVCQFTVPLPAREKWDLSCARNMRLAVKAVPFGENTKCSIQSCFLVI